MHGDSFSRFFKYCLKWQQVSLRYNSENSLHLVLDCRVRSIVLNWEGKLKSLLIYLYDPNRCFKPARGAYNMSNCNLQYYTVRFDRICRITGVRIRTITVQVQPVFDPPSSSVLGMFMYDVRQKVLRRRRGRTVGLAPANASTGSTGCPEH